MKVHLQLEPAAQQSKVLLDGVDQSSNIRAVTVNAEVGQLTTVEIEYACVEVVVNGETEVIHVCPYPPEESSDGTD